LAAVVGTFRAVRGTHAAAPAAPQVFLLKEHEMDKSKNKVSACAPHLTPTSVWLSVAGRRLRARVHL
jgi:hypothetical protein